MGKYMIIPQNEVSSRKLSIHTSSLGEYYPMTDLCTAQDQPHRFIKLIDEENCVADILDSYNEDPFMLESFNDMIMAHFEESKDFILARVITEDNNDSTKVYYSYYAAHHLNKVIFRTEPDKALLHRMKAKNPLNNMRIVGDVQYFVLKYTDHRTSKVNPTSPIEVITDTVRTMFKTLFSKESAVLISSPKKINSAPTTPVSKLESQIQTTTTPIKTVRRNSFDNAKSSKAIHLNYPDTMSVNHIKSISYKNQHQNGSMNIEEWVLDQLQLQPTRPNPTTLQKRTSPRRAKEGTPSPTLINISSPSKVDYYTAKFYATCDDFLMQSAVRQYFKSNALLAEDALLFHLDPVQVSLNDVAVEHVDPVTSVVRLFMKSRLFRVCLVLYVLSGVLITAFVVPDQYKFITAFLFSFIICLAAVIFM